VRVFKREVITKCIAAMEVEQGEIVSLHPFECDVVLGRALVVAARQEHGSRQTYDLPRHLMKCWQPLGPSVATEKTIRSTTRVIAVMGASFLAEGIAELATELSEASARKLLS
jgi:hypothetical protein